jgi:DNA-binding transcriptional regulator GbsR (MarR family)
MSSSSVNKNLRKNELYFNLNKRIKQKNKRVEKHLKKNSEYYRILEENMMEQIPQGLCNGKNRIQQRYPRYT